MMVTLRVRLFTVEPGPRYDEPLALSDLPRVALEVDDGTPLAAALLDATKQAGVEADSMLTRSGYYLAFPLSDRAANEPVSWGFEIDTEYFGVDQDGHLVLDGPELKRLTVGDWQRARVSGYYPGISEELVLVKPDGLGGPGEFANDLLAFFRDINVNIVATVVAARLSLRPIATWKQRQDDKRARRVLKGWHQKGIDGPDQIARWVDKKDSWTATEVAERLNITSKGAEEILEALGFEFHQRRSAWVPGTSDAAIERRRRWDGREAIDWDRPEPLD